MGSNYLFHIGIILKPDRRQLKEIEYQPKNSLDIKSLSRTKNEIYA